MSCLLDQFGRKVDPLEREIDWAEKRMMARIEAGLYAYEDTWPRPLEPVFSRGAPLEFLGLDEDTRGDDE